MKSNKLKIIIETYVRNYLKKNLSSVVKNEVEKHVNRFLSEQYIKKLVTESSNKTSHRDFDDHIDTSIGNLSPDILPREAIKDNQEDKKLLEEERRNLREKVMKGVDPGVAYLFDGIEEDSEKMHKIEQGEVDPEEVPMDFINQFVKK